MSTPENNSEKASQNLQRHAGRLLIRPSSLLERITQTQTQRDHRQQLADLVKTRAVEIREAESREAASVCKLKTEFFFQMLTDQALSEHRDELGQKQIRIQEEMLQKTAQIMEGKEQQKQRLESLIGDPDLLAEAREQIEKVHDRAWQGVIDRNQDG